jgi:hypothetical protein
MGEDGAAEGPRDEPNGERGESGEGPGYRIKGWEEDLVEDQGRGSAEAIVVPMRLAKATLRERNNGASLDRGEVSR